MRVDQPMPQAHLTAARALRLSRVGGRPIVTLASVVEGEDTALLGVISEVRTYCQAQNMPPPLFIYVPRAPDRFETFAEIIAAHGFTFARRSTLLAAELSLLPDAT